MDEYIPGFMTDEQALATLKSLKFTMERGSAKSIFQHGLLEAMCHAPTISPLVDEIKALRGEE